MYSIFYTIGLDCRFANQYLRGRSSFSSVMSHFQSVTRAPAQLILLPIELSNYDLAAALRMIVAVEDQ
jgi:hypothetical protein